jgi:molybdopterin-containing oxidoreductase family iron-sulfur binding subunit
MPSLTRQWRTLKELADDPEFAARAAEEFPALAARIASPQERRNVLKLMGAALAMAGLSGCGNPVGSPSGTLMPPVIPPKNPAAGLGGMFATASVTSGWADGVLVRHDVGRPIKVEGNPQHPASLGGTDAIGQAQILGFYDPDRAAPPLRDGVPRDWQTLSTDLTALRAALAENHGDGLRILTGSVTSPTLARQMTALQKHYPAMRWHRWEPMSRDAVRAGAKIAYGAPLEFVPHPGAADVILAVDSDMISSAPGHLRFAREFVSRRNPVRTDHMSRVYAMEPTPTLIGVAADQRFRVGPGDLPRFFGALSDAILRNVALPSGLPKGMRQLVADLRAAHGHALVHVGPHQPAEMHALALAMNEALGGRGTTWDMIDPVEASPDQSLHELLSDMQAGKVHALFVIDSNPVFTAPGSWDFAAALKQVAFSVTLDVGVTETARATKWSLPLRHPFEDWSDARAFDGAATILQPQAQPLHDGVSAHRILGLLASVSVPDSREIVRATWRNQFSQDFEKQWFEAVAAGVVPNTSSGKSDAPLRPEAATARVPQDPSQPISVLFRTDPYVWDGRYANNAWLQELPRPLTKLTWDNPLLISPEIGRRLNVGNGQRVVLSLNGREIELPAWIMPGQAADCIVATLGFGRRDAGTVGNGTGFNLYPLTGTRGVPSLRKGKGREVLASTEHHSPMEARPDDFVRRGTLADFQKTPNFLADHKEIPSLYERKPPGPAQWGMSVDLNSCIGCNACVVACMAENNIPTVGKEQIIREREMHWLRIDRYYEGPVENPATFFQPVLCMHCENAPCEIVCPVGATVHDSEGLNVMVYNRCIGTRFCSNNCPYKVRRFNYFAFSHEEHRPAVARNPEVSVRGRGVMEKCTFCLQRIAAARIVADAENRPVGAEEVHTACQAACPTQAFTFGNMAAPDAKVVERKESPLTYSLLVDQNTRPRVTYEGRILNPGTKDREEGA